MWVICHHCKKMLSSAETVIKSENDLPLNLKTHETHHFSSTPPESPVLSHVPEHILMAVNHMNNSHLVSSPIGSAINSSIASSMISGNAVQNHIPASLNLPSKICTPPMNSVSNPSSTPGLNNNSAVNALNRIASPVIANSFNSCPAVTSLPPTTMGPNIGVFGDHNGQPLPHSFPPANGTYSLKGPPNLHQGFNHVTNHVTSLPSSIGRLTIGLSGHYHNSCIPEQEELTSPVSSGGGISPPLSPLQPPSPPPTMVLPPGSERSSNCSRSASSPTNGGGLSGLHHALHGLHNFHNLHNLHSLQSLQTQMAALASLQGGLGAQTVGSLLHSHLAAQQQTDPLSNPVTSSGNGISQPSSPSSSVPQMVLTAGQVPQTVQGAQLLIPTSQGIAVQPILTIPLGQAGPMPSSTLINPLSSFHHLSGSSQLQTHTTHAGSSNSSPLPTSSSSSSSSSSNHHPLLGLAGLPASLFHPHGGHNNNNNSTNNNNNIISPEKPKLPLPLSSPAQDAISGLSARLSGGYHGPHHMTPSARYSPDFLDTHNQPTINQSTSNVVDGVNLDEIKEFAKAFKIRRLSLGLTQTQVGQALSITEGPAYSQSAICRYKNGQHTLTDYMGNEPSKKRKRRTSFTPQALEVLNAHFERNTHPSGAEITAMGEQLGYEREVVRIWFCNKRQALKNTVRIMAKSSPASVPPHSIN